MRVFISACGEGFGHTSRMLALHDALKQEGHTVALAGYGDSLEVMRKAGANAFQTYPEIKMVGSGGRFDIFSSIIKSYRTPYDVTRAYLAERDRMRAMRADAVVSDSRLSTVIAGTSCGLPTFYVTNQSEFQMPSLPVMGSKRLRVLRILAKAKLPSDTIRKMMDVPLSTPYSFSDRVLIPDFAPPNTICLPLLSRDLEMRKKTYFTGPMNGLCLRRPKPAKWEGRRPKVLVTFGGQRFRAGLVGKLIRSALKLPQFDFLVTSLFVKKDVDVANVRMRKFLPDLLPSAAAADFLVIPAGHSSIMESILLEKPAIIVPDRGQPEQESNAKRYEALGLGRMLPVDKAESLGSALARLKAGERGHRAKLKMLSDAGRGRENGPRNAALMIEKFAERIRY